MVDYRLGDFRSQCIGAGRSSHETYAYGQGPGGCLRRGYGVGDAGLSDVELVS